MSGIQPFQSRDMQINRFNDQTILAVGELDDRVTALEAAAASRVMAADEYSYLYWPCDEPLVADGAIPTLLHNETTTTGGGLTIITTGSATYAPGFVLPSSLRLYDSTTGNKGASGAAAKVPTSSGVSLSFWARLGVTSGTTFIAGYWENGAAPIFAMKMVNGAATAFVQNLAGAQTVAATSDMIVGPGEWHHYGVSYTGGAAIVWVDGVFSSQGAGATSAIDWTYGTATRLWRIGYSGNAANCYGFFQDIRVDSCSRNYLWYREAYHRGIGVFSEFGS